MRKILFLFFILLLFLLGCSRYQPPAEKVPETITVQFAVPFELHPNQTAMLPAERLSVNVISLEDNRCPIGAECNDTGSVKVKLNLSIGSAVLGTKTFEVYEDDFFSKEIIDSYVVRISRVTPKPKLDEEIPYNDYVVTIILDELDSFS